MRPTQIVVTSSNSPVVIPVNGVSGDDGVVTCLPSGSGNYTVATSNDDLYNLSITPTYTAIAAMTTETAQVSLAFSSGITALKITLHSGDDVTTSVSQR
jgi:hypothetical protein